eukprot:375195-Karenia_brevis.AAC.1
MLHCRGNAVPCAGDLACRYRIQKFKFSNLHKQWDMVTSCETWQLTDDTGTSWRPGTRLGERRE